MHILFFDIECSNLNGMENIILHVNRGALRSGVCRLGLFDKIINFESNISIRKCIIISLLYYADSYNIVSRITNNNYTSLQLHSQVNEETKTIQYTPAIEFFANI